MFKITETTREAILNFLYGFEDDDDNGNGAIVRPLIDALAATIERGDLIEIGAPRNGRPGYRWVQGWRIRYSPSRVSQSMRRTEAVSFLRQIRGE